MMTPEKRFENSYMKTSCGCWLWLKTLRANPTDTQRFQNTYGRFWWQGKKWDAHRVAYTWFVGGIPHRALVLHKCDIPSCVNPDHLFLGDYKTNSQDMYLKGREGVRESHHRGELSHLSKLTSDNVLDIRRRCHNGESQGDVAKTYGVGQPTVFKIVHRQRWAHI